eukprot:gene6629-4749_t
MQAPEPCAGGAVVRSTLCDEFDASVEMGSGIIAVAGPPGSGKTFSVVQYLSDREVQAQLLAGPSVPCVRVEYWTARSLAGGALLQMSQRISGAAPGAKRRRAAAAPTELSQAVAGWLAEQTPGSELHLVVDDADCWAGEDEDWCAWLDSCLLQASTTVSSVFLWVLLQVPRRSFLSSCFRWHLLHPPQPGVVLSWVRAHSGAADGDESLVQRAVAHYLTNQPMCSSLASRDVRSLLLRVYERLPALLEAARGRTPNSLHYAKAWAAPSSGPAAAPSEERLVAQGLRSMGYTVVVLAFAAFYCGAVPRQLHHRALAQKRAAGASDVHRRSAAATSSLASTNFSFSSSVLASVYRSLLPICAAQVDPAELATPRWALEHSLPRLLGWGLLTTTARSRRMYRCWISVATAAALGDFVGINLSQLVPL